MDRLDAKVLQPAAATSGFERASCRFGSLPKPVMANEPVVGSMNGIPPRKNTRHSSPWRI